MAANERGAGSAAGEELGSAADERLAAVRADGIGIRDRFAAVRADPLVDGVHLSRHASLHAYSVPLMVYVDFSID